MQHRLLLAAACGGMLAAPAAHAAIVNETTDFSDDSATPAVPPAGTTASTGTSISTKTWMITSLRRPRRQLRVAVDRLHDDARWRSRREYSLDLVFLDSALNQIGSAHFNQTNALVGSVNVTVPADGVIIGRVFQDYADAFNGTSYAVSFDTAAIPEPGTAAIAGLSAAALLAR